jgi:hypothetical protein
MWVLDLTAQWAFSSILEPMKERIISKLSNAQNLAANPTLAALTDIRKFLNNIQTSMDDPAKLIAFTAFLITVPLFSTIFVALLTDVKLKVFGLPLAKSPVKASPLAVLFIIVIVFGNIPLVNFFPEQATHVQALLTVQPGHYHGVIARVLRIVAFYEQFELAARVLLEMVLLARHRHLQVARLLCPASIRAWLLTFGGFTFRMWLTRVSTDTAMSPIQSASTIWAWGKVTLRTDIRYQSLDEFNDDVFIWIAYFATTFCVLFVHYALTPRHGMSALPLCNVYLRRALEVYQSVEPTVITASASILTASAGCQTIVSGDEWVTKSSVAKTQAVIDSNMKRTAIFSRDWLNKTDDTPEDQNELMLLWQNDHTALQAHISLLRGLRVIVEAERAEARKQRQLAENASATVGRLEQAVRQLKKDYHKSKPCKKEYQDQIDVLKKGMDVPDAAMNKKPASLPRLDYLLSLIGH